MYIGNSPLVGNAKVMIDPDRLFGRHLAVLGNTGSGKSCSVAGLIRWSLESANISKTKKTFQSIAGLLYLTQMENTARRLQIRRRQIFIP